MHLSMLCPTTPTRAIMGNRRGFEFCKVQMHHLLGMPVSQIPTFVPPKSRGKDGEFDRRCSYYGTCLWRAVKFPMYGASFSVKTGQMPHLFPSIAREGGSGA